MITDRTGEPIARLCDQFRVATDPDDIADTMKAAVVAIEDRRFFSHGGVHWRGVGRAVVSNFATSGAVFDGQGASTITMQYVKTDRLHARADDPAERDAAVADTLDRKLLDVTVALALEDRLGKEEILARYLDIVYFGNGAYGVAAAARTYFATTPAELTLPQAALLAAIVKAPSTFDPIDGPAAALARRDLVLSAMAEVGSIIPGQADAARATDLCVVEPLVRVEQGCVAADPGTAFFCRYVMDHLEERGLDAEDLRTGGYTLHTTWDARAQRAAPAPPRSRSRPAPSRGSRTPWPSWPRPRRPQGARARREPRPGPGRRTRTDGLRPADHRGALWGRSIYKIFTAVAALEAGLAFRSELPATERYTSEVFTDGG